jgi:hypothetical protein
MKGSSHLARSQAGWFGPYMKEVLR